MQCKCQRVQNRAFRILPVFQLQNGSARHTLLDHGAATAIRSGNAGKRGRRRAATGTWVRTQCIRCDSGPPKTETRVSLQRGVHALTSNAAFWHRRLTAQAPNRHPLAKRYGQTESKGWRRRCSS